MTDVGEGGDQPVTDKTAQNREIESLGLDPEDYDKIEKEFQQFLQEIIGNQNLDRFRGEYDRIHKTLKTSYEGEKKYIKRCKDLNNQIFDKAQNVRAAIRVASSVVEEISALKTKVNADYEELARKKEKEERDRQSINKLKQDIANLKRQS